MIRIYYKVHFLLFCLLLAACGANTVTQPTGILEADKYTQEGLNAFSEDDRSSAQKLFTRALILYQSLDNQEGVLISHINLAEVSLALNDVSATQKHLDAATNIINKTLQPDIQSRITLLNSVNALKQNKISQAENIIQTLLPEFDHDTPIIPPSQIQLLAIAHRTKIAFVQKQGETLWTRRFANVLKISTLKKHSLNARLLRFQSMLLQRSRDYLEAETKLQQALVDYKKIPSRSGIAVTLSELGQLAVIEKRWQDARGYYNRSLAVYRYLNDSDKISKLTECLVKIKRAADETIH